MRSGLRPPANKKIDNRARLRGLIERAGITQKEATELIAKASGDRVSERTLRSWLGAPALPSARPCPGWAVKFLEQKVRK